MINHSSMLFIFIRNEFLHQKHAGLHYRSSCFYYIYNKYMWKIKFFVHSLCMSNLLGMIAACIYSIEILHINIKRKNIKIKQKKLASIIFFSVSLKNFFLIISLKKRKYFFQTMVVIPFEFRFEVRFKVNGYSRPRSVDRVRSFTLIFSSA